MKLFGLQKAHGWDVNITVSVSVVHGNWGGGEYRVPVK